MSDSMPTDSDPEWTGSAEPGATGPSRSGLLAVVVGSGAQAACTIFPPDVAAPYRTTAWITAHGDSFVELEDMR
ncbi:DUF7511 domain-containing protein [Natrinema limicola]|uniref:DUF7511 domain-containing protein n=1 Tax=Natrinema limicola JCM 13563 TaxID=1230457 RepID=M0C674_9EURY|nr:hypothetical protein [Natrinema limicola]ELZ17424.1 hypothetical protein C476_15780 [Natrinema limicola JCM 13563]